MLSILISGVEELYFITFDASMKRYIQIKSIFLLVVFSIITIHNTLPHFHHAHDISENVISEEIDSHAHDGGHHHHHDNEKQSDHEDGDFLFSLLLNSHAHDTAINEDLEILGNYNKVVIGENLPIISLLTKHHIPPDIVVVSEKKNFQHKHTFRQELLVLNCPLRAPPTLG